MRSLSLATIAVALLGTALVSSIPSSAQSLITPHKKVFGYQDQSGVFHPAMRPEPDATATPTGGTIELVLTITLKTPLPKGGSVLCGQDLSAESINESTGAASVYEEDASVVATVSGSTATCTVNVPYSWAIPAASSTVINQLSGSYEIEMVTAGSALPGIVRLSEGSFLSDAKIPAPGTVSKYTVAAVI